MEPDDLEVLSKSKENCNKVNFQWQWLSTGAGAQGNWEISSPEDFQHLTWWDGEPAGSSSNFKIVQDVGRNGCFFEFWGWECLTLGFFCNNVLLFGFCLLEKELWWQEQLPCNTAVLATEIYTKLHTLKLCKHYCNHTPASGFTETRLQCAWNTPLFLSQVVTKSSSNGTSALICSTQH